MMMADTFGWKDVVLDIRLHIKASGLSARAWAVKNGFSAQFVSLVLNYHKKPSKRLAAVIGLEEVPRQERRWRPIKKTRKG